jgi:hypothetical protein
MRLHAGILAIVCACFGGAPRVAAQDFRSDAGPSPYPRVIEDEQPVQGRPLDHGLYGQIEYVLWWLREGRVPPLLTTSAPASAGVLGRADTQILYGDDRLETRHGDRFNGTRFTLGYRFGDCQALGVEASAFFLERDSTHFKATSDGGMVLAIPFINALDGRETSDIIAGTGPLGPRTGQFVGYSRVELFGQEINAVVSLHCDPSTRLDLLLGARFLQMRDRVDLTATGRLLPAQTTLFGLTDHFRVGDQFYGGQAGLRGEWCWGRCSLAVTGEVAPGATVALVRAFGDRLFQTPAERLSSPFGLFVQPSNSGSVTHTDFDFVYQLTVNAGWRLCDHVRLFTGYTFLGWTSPLRAGDQIDRVVNLALTANPPHGPDRPALPFRSDTFWAQGWNAGVELSW